MLKHIGEFNKYVLITGFSNVKIKNIGEFLTKTQAEIPLNVEAQFFDAKFVASWQHLFFAALNALTAFKNKRNISKTVALETMLYASAQRQIRKAMEMMGITSHTSEIATLIIGENTRDVKPVVEKISKRLNARHDDAVLELSPKKENIVQKAFGISELELQTVRKKEDLGSALINLVIERMALLATQH